MRVAVSLFLFQRPIRRRLNAGDEAADTYLGDRLAVDDRLDILKVVSESVLTILCLEATLLGCKCWYEVKSRLLYAYDKIVINSSITCIDATKPWIENF